MRNYIILNNKKSDTISGLIIQELPPISKPAQRTQIETIDGRDGDIVTPLGYAAYDKTFTIGLYGTFDINEIIAYFATQGQVIFSNEPNKYYNYQIVDQIDYERLVRYRVATVTMHVQPFKYSSTETPIIVDSSDTVSGEGSNIALDGTAEAPFNTLRHKGNATQKSLSGKNLCSNAIYESANTVKLTVNKANIQKTITISYISDVTAPDGTIYLFTDGTNRGSLNNTIKQTANTRESVTFTMSDTVFGYIQAATNVWFTSYVTNAGHDTSKTPQNAQIENGSLTDYEPYVGNLPSPSPDYPQDIQVLTGESTVKITGKNLWDPDDLVKGYINDSGTITIGGGLDKSTQFLPIIGGRSYTISSSYNGNAYYKIAQYDAKKNFIKIKNIA